MSTIESPGSMNDFQQSHPELSKEELNEAYGSRLDQYRKGLAAEIGISMSDLHEQGFRLTSIILGEEGEQAA